VPDLAIIGPGMYKSKTYVAAGASYKVSSAQMVRIHKAYSDKIDDSIMLFSWRRVCICIELRRWDIVHSLDR
jgi:hypothetical protein